MKNLILLSLVLVLLSCENTQKATATFGSYPDVRVKSAMKNVMWKGELAGKINLDTITDKKGLYGIGPVSFLRGEILVKNGECFVSKVATDSTMTVEKNCDVSAPFFVYANVTEWQEEPLPATVKSIADLEEYVNEKTQNYKRPFAFKLAGKINSALIHIQNLPLGTNVSSPKEAHSGQVKYELGVEEVEIIGFFSTEHQGIFTHYDTYLHLHLITKDEQKMGHLDAVELGEMRLFLPK